MLSGAVKCDPWLVRKPGALESGTAMTRLIWRFEDGPEDADSDEDPNDVGPAWLVLPDGAEELINGFDWISRDEARRLASESGYRIFEEG